MASHERVLDRDASVLVVVDVQEAYRGKTLRHDRMERGVRILVEAARTLGIPVLATEQYPKGLGPLVPEIRRALPEGTEPIAKLSLSCCGEPRFVEELRKTGRKQVVVCGIEAHACVNQTVHDLLARGYAVHVPCDAISSRFEHDLRAGWEKMLGSGAVPSSVEMACFEWLRRAGTPEFKAIQALVR
ncbi:MAG: hydrolase [Candidatus Binatia bacterium]|nr:MAG: hydrolase [Candidatus Binatia bacterium]